MSILGPRKRGQAPGRLLVALPVDCAGVLLATVLVVGGGAGGGVALDDSEG